MWPSSLEHRKSITTSNSSQGFSSTIAINAHLASPWVGVTLCFDKCAGSVSCRWGFHGPTSFSDRRLGGHWLQWQAVVRADCGRVPGPCRINNDGFVAQAFTLAILNIGTVKGHSAREEARRTHHFAVCEGRSSSVRHPQWHQPARSGILDTSPSKPSTQIPISTLWTSPSRRHLFESAPGCFNTFGPSRPADTL